jgi:glycosyltransferase involved in cell wall biosynthesis
MYSIKFIDFSPSIHHERFSSFLRKYFLIQSHYTSQDLSELKFDSADILLIGEIDKTLAIIEEVALPKIGISWARDIERILERPVPSTIQRLHELDLILVDCNHHNQNLVSLGVNPEQIINFPFGVNLEKYIFSSKPSKKSNFSIFSNRSWEENYGHEILLEAFAEFSNYSDRVTLRIAGEGSLKGRLLDKYKSLVNSGALIPLGKVSEEKNIEELKNCDLYISASKFDGTSVSILESMAIGTPVIVSDIPPNHEIITNGYNGLMFQAENSKDLAVKIREIFNSPINRVKFANRSREIIENRANWTENMNTFTSRILTLLN